MTNQQKLDQTHSQLNDRASWLFTHIADTLLGRGFDVAESAGTKTTLAREISYLPANFKLVRDKVDAVLATQVSTYLKSSDDTTVYAFSTESGKIRTVTKAEWDMASSLGHKVAVVSKTVIANAPK